MTISAPAEGDDVSRLKLLLGDIRTISEGKVQMPSADLVKDLIAIEGHPWAEMGKAGKPLTQNRLARMLKPLGITPENIRIGDKVPKGYVFAHFDDAFTRYLPQEGAFEPLHRFNADETGTSEPFQTATSEDDVADGKCEKPSNDGHRSGRAVQKGVSGKMRANGDGLGMSERRIRELAEWYQDEYHRRYNDGTLDTAKLDAELRAILREEVDLPEHVEIEFKRVMDMALAV